MRRRPLSESSFLRRADARTKLLLSLVASAAVTLPLPQLGALAACFSALAFAAGIGTQALMQLRRMRLFLVVLFAVDWLFVGFDFAVLISLRLALLATAFTLLVATTAPDELRVALERLGVPRRLAFTFTTAFGSLAVFQQEWGEILEAQRARGIVPPRLQLRRWRDWPDIVAQLTWLIVPAFVLATQRAWSITEAATLRGFESPQRCADPVAGFALLDLLLSAGAVAVFAGLLACR
jgi:biotin transport system permease protein